MNVAVNFRVFGRIDVALPVVSFPKTAIEVQSRELDAEKAYVRIFNSAIDTGYDPTKLYCKFLYSTDDEIYESEFWQDFDEAIEIDKLLAE